jgi:hypothetical protein
MAPAARPSTQQLLSQCDDPSLLIAAANVAETRYPALRRTSRDVSRNLAVSRFQSVPGRPVLVGEGRMDVWSCRTDSATTALTASRRISRTYHEQADTSQRRLDWPLRPNASLNRYLHLLTAPLRKANYYSDHSRDKAVHPCWKGAGIDSFLTVC